MIIEVTAKEKKTREEVNILLHDVPEDATQGELIRYFRLYQAQAGNAGDWEVVGFAKVTMESGNERLSIES